MDFGLKELGSTFLVGAFTILGLELILYHFLGIQLTGFLHERLRREKDVNRNEGQAGETNKPGRKDKDQSMNAAIFIGLAFAVGIVAEDLSYKYFDDTQELVKNYPARIWSILPTKLDQLGLVSKYDSRVKTLMLGEEPQWLMKDLARNGAFSSVYGKVANQDSVGEKVENWAKGTSQVRPSEDEIREAISRLYYYAKNTAYHDINYYDEMKRIQTRLEFARSISVIAFLYFIIASLLTIYVVLVDGRLHKRGRDALTRIVPAIKRRNRPSRRYQQRKPYLKAAAILLGLLCVYFSGAWAYLRESDELNKRAFGYFSSMLMKEKLTQPGK